MRRGEVNSGSVPILFVLGPSGSGKSTLASWVRNDLSFLHLEIDRFPEGNGIDLEHLRKEWDAFWNGADPQPLAAALNDRALDTRARGVILSFPSGVVPTSSHITSAAQVGIQMLILYGTGAECLEAFLQREQASGRGLKADHWIRYNALAYAAFSLPSFAAHRLMMFENGRFRTRTALVAEVRERAG